ncbi:hypothetical protein L195_g038843 [Trifolium pratense]|uniref:Uncharacterized protein n=1 Tax=Trifolium pratense TaxID=57577 RepID=A0A2K3LW97_TRIPR|nr:hypothetical protein L195_g038843 [Trifolium pratense]
MVRPTPCIESLPDKGGQAAGPVEHINGDLVVGVCEPPNTTSYTTCQIPITATSTALSPDLKFGEDHKVSQE